MRTATVLFLLGTVIGMAAQTTLPLPFANLPGVSYSALTNSALDGQSTAYTSVSNNDAKLFRGVFIPTNSNTKLAIHSDDGSTVKVDGTQKVSKRGENTQLQNPNSFDVINVAWVVGQSYCIEIDYSNGMTNINDRDGVTLYAYDGGGVAGVHPILRGGGDALCVGQSFTLTADCGEAPYTWISSVPAVATVSGGTVTGVAPSAATITVTDSDNHSATLTVEIIRPGISPALLVTCVGLTNTFVLTNAPGTGAVSWSQSGALSMDTRTNSLAITNAGTNILTATYAGCSASATVVVVAVSSLLPSTTNICNGGSVIYTNQTTPPGFGHLVNWGGGGLMGTGSSRTNSYTVGNYLVSNWCGTSVKYSTTTVFQLSLYPNARTIFAGSGPADFTLVSNQVPVTWQVSPGPASIGMPPFTAGTVLIYPSPFIGTTHTVTARAVGLPSCVATAALHVVKLTVSANLVAVCEGGSASLSFTVEPSNYLGQIAFDTVTNSSGSGPANTHATVSVSGTNLTITGLTTGSAWLRAQTGGSSNLPTAIKIVRVTFPTNAYYIKKNTFNGTLPVHVAPVGAPVTFRSENPAIAAVGLTAPNLVVGAFMPGTTRIFAEAQNGDMCAMKEITVFEIDLSPSDRDLCVGETGTFQLTVNPTNVPVSVLPVYEDALTISRVGNTVYATALKTDREGRRGSMIGLKFARRFEVSLSYFQRTISLW